MIHLNLAFDNHTVTYLSHLLDGHADLRNTIEDMAVYLVYLVPILWVVAWFYPGVDDKRRTALIGSILSGLVAWFGVNKILKAIAYHPRPDSVLPVKEILFSRPENSFPSDHTAFLIAIATYFLVTKQYKWAGVTFAVLGVIVGISRVAVAVHYPSDIVVGILSGILSGYIVVWLQTPIEQYITKPLIKFARVLRLA